MEFFHTGAKIFRQREKFSTWKILEFFHIECEKKHSRSPGRWAEGPGKIRNGFPIRPGKHVPRGPLRCYTIFLVTFKHKLSIFQKLEKFRIFFFEFEFFENWLRSDFWRQTIGVQAKMHRKSFKILKNFQKSIFRDPFDRLKLSVWRYLCTSAGARSMLNQKYS